jgi:hypothetical protein
LGWRAKIVVGRSEFVVGFSALGLGEKSLLEYTGWQFPGTPCRRMPGTSDTVKAEYSNGKPQDPGTTPEKKTHADK